MKPKHCLLVVVSLLILSPAYAGDLVFESDTARLVLAENGVVKSLVDKASGKEWTRLSQEPAAAVFGLVRASGRMTAASSITREGDKLTIRFGQSGCEADYRITARKSYFLIELLSVLGADVEELVFAQLPVAGTKYSSGILNVKWDDQFTVCLMALDERFESGFKGSGMRCTAYREFGLDNHRVALIAVPTARLYEVVPEIEREFKIPHATLGGQWAKTSEEVRRSYLFVDLTENNVDEIIRLAKLGGFGAVLIYSGTWSTSHGSYPLNTKNFPGGEAGLKEVIDKCHQAGLKVGMHMLTSFVSKNDPLVRPKPDPRLMKDGQAVLATDISASDSEIPAGDSMKAFSLEPTYSSSQGGMDVQIDDEIIRYSSIGGRSADRLLGCERGACGTVAAPHKAGAAIHHLAQSHNSYLADLRTTLKDQIADRIAGLINRCGFDMIYFDGGEANHLNGPRWYWMGAQQSAVFSRVRRELLVQSSGKTHWTWHIMSRGTCDDFAALAPKQFLDCHKIADSWTAYRNLFLPAELGWWGFLSATPYCPATMPDEVEHYAVRMLALDTPVSLETTLAALKANGRTVELLKLLSQYEQVRLSRSVPPEIREKLKTGEWHSSRDAQGRWVFQPVRYDAQRMEVPGTFPLRNSFKAQPLCFRMQVVPRLARPGDSQNIPLMNSSTPIMVPLPAASDAMPGALAHRVTFAATAGDQPSAFMVGATAPKSGKLTGTYKDLLHHRALAIRLRVDDAEAGQGALPPVLNVQLESDGKRYRDHYVDLDFTGERTVIIPEPTAERMLPEFRPAAANYTFKHAGYTFDYGRIVALNLRWMRLPQGQPVHCEIGRIEALAESDAILKNPRLIMDGQSLLLPGEMKTGDYAECWGQETVRIFTANGVQKKAVHFQGPVPLLNGGATTFQVQSERAAPVKVTLMTLDNPLPPLAGKSR